MTLEILLRCQIGFPGKQPVNQVFSLNMPKQCRGIYLHYKKKKNLLFIQTSNLAGCLVFFLPTSGNLPVHAFHCSELPYLPDEWESSRASFKLGSFNLDPEPW